MSTPSLRRNREFSLLQFSQLVSSGGSQITAAASVVPTGLAIPSTAAVVRSYELSLTPDRLLGRVDGVRTTMRSRSPRSDRSSPATSSTSRRSARRSRSSRRLD